MRSFCLVFYFQLVFVYSFAQTTVLNNNPPSIKWRQVNTPFIKVIYQEGTETEAQRVANTLEHIRKVESATLGRSPRKLSVILQSQAAIANGFVSLTPRRSEFYMMPSQNYNFLGSNEWLTLLAVHEYRHVVQFENAITGFNKLFYYAFGPATTAAMASLSVPQWFWEGDAVATETALTGSGRGRIPAFNMMFRTNLLEGRSFNYEKQMLQSYKHFIPNHYVLGYNMVSFLREKTNDPGIWGKVTHRTWNIPFLPFRFSNSIHAYSGVRVSNLYKEMAAAYTQRWQEELNQLTLTSFEYVHRRPQKTFTNYNNPQVMEDGSVVVMKEGIGDIDQLVVLKNGLEKTVFTVGIVNESGMLSSANSKVVWNEYEFNPRWRAKSYSVIKSYDVVTGQLFRISTASRYAGAALSPDGYKVVTVETDTQYKTVLVILDFFSGKILQKFPNAENYFYSMPRFSADGKTIVVLKTTPIGKTISILNTTTGVMEDLLPVSDENIGHPVLHDSYVFFNSPVSGIDNIYAYDVQQKIRYQVTSSKYGAFNPSFSKDGKTLYYNEQSGNGLDVVKMEVIPEMWPQVLFERPVKTFFEFLAEQEGRPNLLDSIPQQTLSSKKYSKLAGIVQPISWGAYFDNDFSSTTLGITSRDKLSSTAISAGYNYNVAERAGAWSATLSYQGLLPIVDVSASLANRSVNEGDLLIREVFNNIDLNQKDTIYTNRNATFRWKEQTLSMGMRIPFVFTHSKYISSVTFSNAVAITKVADFSNTAFPNQRYVPGLILRDIENGDTTTRVGFYIFRNYVGNNTLLYNRFRFSTSRYFKQSARDFLPKWGQIFNIEWYKTGFGSGLSGNLFATYAQLYFPGLFKHHSFNVYWAYQSSAYSFDRERNYLFPNRIPVPRGQTVYGAEKFYAMSANYALPLWYPDIHIGPLLNVQRIRLNGFVDYGFGSSPKFDSSASYLSVGGEVKFDFNVFRILPQLDMGFRYTIGLSPRTTTFELLLGTINF